MSIFNFFRKPEPPAGAVPVRPEKAVIHIARFERALAQATDPKKKRYLAAWLAYYRQLAAAERP